MSQPSFVVWGFSYSKRHAEVLENFFIHVDGDDYYGSFVQKEHKWKIFT